MRLLLDADVDVKHRTRCGWTPLHHAVSFGHVETATLLLERGADPRAHTSRRVQPHIHTTLATSQQPSTSARTLFTPDTLQAPVR